MSLQPTQPAFDFALSTPDAEPKFRKHSRTSRQAAEKVVPVVKKMHAQILLYLAASPIRSADETADALGISFMNARPRFDELKKSGLIHRTGEGATFFGNAQDAYSLTEKGKQLAGQLLVK